MSLEDVEQMYSNAQRLLRDIIGEIELDSAVQLNTALSKILVDDVEFGLSRHVDRELWKVYRNMIETATTADIKAKENAVSLSISWLGQLSLQLHARYRLQPHKLPVSLAVSPVVLNWSRLKDISDDSRLSLLGFIAFRMGDLMRYKNECLTADQLYHTALELQPFNGTVWNQLGLMARQRGSQLDAIYYHTRALHSQTPFPLASTNISSILRKYSEKTQSVEDAPFQELFLTVLAKLHFMMPVSKELTTALGGKLVTVRSIVPLLALYSTLGDEALGEKTSKQVIEQLLKTAFRDVFSKLESGTDVDSSLLSCLSLLLRLPGVCEPKEAQFLNTETLLQLEDYLQYFVCLTDPLNYPPKWNQLKDLLKSGEEMEGETPNEKEKKLEREIRRPVQRYVNFTTFSILDVQNSTGRSVFPSINKTGRIFQYIYRQMTTLVSTSGGGGQQAVPPDEHPPTPSTAHSLDSSCSMLPEKLAPSDEVINFLLDHMVSREPILSSIKIDNRNELKQLLGDIVAECYSCSSSCCLRDDSGLVGICLASRPTLFEKQMDRLCAYDFKDEGMTIAVEFLKYLFNRVDFVYHCEESGVTKPRFDRTATEEAAVVPCLISGKCCIHFLITAPNQLAGRCIPKRKLASLSVEIEKALVAMARRQALINTAIGDKCDGIVALCSGYVYYKLVGPSFKDQIKPVKMPYQNYHGSYRYPPIRPSDPRNSDLLVLLTKLP